MNGYEKIEGDGDTITCDNCSDIVENWHTDGTHAVCGKCATGKAAGINNLPPLFTGILHSFIRISEQQQPEKTVSDIKKELVEGEGDE
jgi:hypothetical protein